jgi:hypothetical protein
MKTALYTTIHPGVMPFVRAWWTSVCGQTDTAFDLWLGIDGVKPAELEDAVGGPIEGRLLEAEAGWTPALIRQNALAEIVESYESVVLVDSDDVLLPERVQAAKSALQECDLTACAMHLIDAAGAQLGVVMTVPAVASLCSLLVSQNVFGFSNTAYRCSTLRQCLPLSADLALADWYLATRACLADARLGFDPEPRMLYRQHPKNIARVVPPFTAAEVATAARLVLDHYRVVSENANNVSPLLLELEEARVRVDTFARRVEEDPDLMRRYVQALNCLPPHHLWWSLVAHPALEDLWNN